MANLPKQFSQEAQDERDMRRKLKNPKDRWSYPMGFCMRSVSSSERGACLNYPKKCSECFRYSEYE